MTTIISGQILPGEEGYVDFKKPPPPEPARVAAVRATPEQDRVTVAGIAVKIEKLLKESRRPTAGEERLDEIGSELRSKVPALCGAISAARRQAAVETLAAFYDPRYAKLARNSVQYFASVQEARHLSAEFGNCRDRGELFSRAQQIVEVFKAECQNEPIS